MNPITLTPDPTNTFYQIAPADYESLISNPEPLVLSTNPDGAQVKISLSATIYDTTTQEESLQKQIAQKEMELSQAQAVDQTAQ